MPHGYAELVLRAQDELRDSDGRVSSSTDFRANIRAMSRSYGYTTDPTRGECRGTQCPESLEIYSGKNVRITTSSSGRFDVVVGARIDSSGKAVLAQRLVITPNGDVLFPDLGAAPHGRNFLCVDDAGKLVSQRVACNQPPAVRSRASSSGRKQGR